MTCLKTHHYCCWHNHFYPFPTAKKKHQIYLGELLANIQHTDQKRALTSCKLLAPTVTWQRTSGWTYPRESLNRYCNICLRSPRILRSVNQQFVTEFSGQCVGPVYKSQDVHPWTSWTSRLYILVMHRTRLTTFQSSLHFWSSDVLTWLPPSHLCLFHPAPYHLHHDFATAKLRKAPR